MKRFLNFYLSMTLIASLFVVVSCKEESDPVLNGPTLSTTAEGDETTMDVWEVLTFTVDVTAPAGLKTLVVNQTVGNGASVSYDSKEGEAGTYSYTFTFVPEPKHAGEQIVFDFVAVDETEAGREAKYTHTVNVNELVAYQTVLLGGQRNTTVESFYNVLENVKYNYSGARTNPAKVDFLYHFQGSDADIIASPDDADSRAAWETYGTEGLPLADMNNITRFKRVTTESSGYENINSENALVNAYVENANPELSRLTELQKGETFVFKLDASRGARYGVAKVIELIPGVYKGADGTVTLDVKIQPKSN